jgi:hypothetical protein
MKREESIMVRSSRVQVGILLAAVGVCATFCASRPVAAAEDPPVSGVFKGNGQEAKLAYVSTAKGEPLADKPTIIIIFTEKNHSEAKKPQVMAGFGKFGSALIVTVYQDGQIVGCQVAHAAHQKGAFNSIGTMKMTDFKLEGGKIQGKLSSGGETETFGQKWEVDLKFQAKAP